MASSSLLLFFLLFSNFYVSLSFLLPISKHSPTNQYLTRIHLGAPTAPVTLVLDLSNPFLWVDCAYGVASSTPVPYLSIHCSTAGNNSRLSTAAQPPPPCTLLAENSISKLTGRGELVADTVALDGPGETKTLDDFLFICAPQFLVNGMASGARGVFGFGRTSRIAPFSQFLHQFDLPGKFSICLPGKNGNGMIFAGKAPDTVAEISRSLVYTPLVGSDSWEDYYIRVKSIKISDKKLSLPVSPIRAKISTIDPFTKMGSGIYRTFLRAFSMAGDALTLTIVEARKPFGLCYAAAESNEVVPVIDLVLQSEMVRWRIGGRNSMVEVGDGVMCLGVVDGGSDLGEEEIVIGAHQLEDVLLEFDLGSGMLGFSSSLLHKGTSCPDLSLYATGGSREFI